MTIGTCNCGAVSFEITGEHKNVYACHCSICRRWTGANGVAVVIVSKHQFRWIEGEQNISDWKKPDADWVSRFCATCGSSLPVLNDAETLAVPAGLIDVSNKDLRVAAHIWTDSKAPWDEICGASPQFKAGFEG